jgi:hypothetical protein
MADETLVDPSTLPHKEQQQLLSKLRDDGQRMNAYHTITDYENATPTFKPVPKKRKSRAKPKTATEEVKETIGEFWPIQEPYLPPVAKTKQDLLTRLNANLRG